MKFRKNFICLLLVFSMVFSFVSADANKTPSTQKSKSPIELYLRDFKDLLEIIEKLYYKDIDYNKFFLDINKSTFSSLDKNTRYFDKDETVDVLESMVGKGIGIGVIPNLKLKYPRIEKVYQNSPAKEAGIQENDLIIAINGKSTKDISEKDYLSLMLGEAGTKVSLTISRIDKKPFAVEVERKEYKIKNVFLDKTEEFPIIRIDSFGGDFANEFDEIIKNNSKLVQKGIIIDLRGNLGGLLEEAIDFLSCFVEPDQVVLTKYEKSNKKEVYKTKKTTIKYKMPIVVLVDFETASASEVLAGSIQNFKRGLIVGQKTYGKGTIQEFYTFDDSTSMKITTAEYKLKEDITVDKVGITPDILVDNKIKDKIEECTLFSKKDAKKGDMSGNVFALQQRLSILGYSVRENGYFDTKTEQALAKYQKQARLEVTKVLDARTKEVIDIDVEKKILSDKNSLQEAIKQLKSKK